MTDEEVAVKLADHDNRIKVSEHRIEDLEESTKQIQEIALSMRDLTNINNGMLKQMESLNKKLDTQDQRLGNLEKKPGENWDLMVKTIITAIFSALAGAAGTLLLTAIR